MTDTPQHEPGCYQLIINGTPMPSCGGTYTCPLCEHEFGWCIGAYDDTPALCDECANLVQRDI